jgi:hypothetical protein
VITFNTESFQDLVVQNYAKFDGNKSSIRSVSSEPSISIQIENEKQSYLDALRRLYVENAAENQTERRSDDREKAQQVVDPSLDDDLSKTNCRDSELFKLPCCVSYLIKKLTLLFGIKRDHQEVL